MTATQSIQVGDMVRLLCTVRGTGGLFLAGSHVTVVGVCDGLPVVRTPYGREARVPSANLVVVREAYTLPADDDAGEWEPVAWPNSLRVAAVVGLVAGFVAVLYGAAELLAAFGGK